MDAEPGDRDAGLDTGTTRPGEFEGKHARLEPAIALPEASIDDVWRQVGKAPPRLGPVQQFDVSQAPAPLRDDQVGLGASAIRRPGDEEVALVPKPDVNSPLQVVEECDALPDQLDLFDVVELQPKRASGDRRSQRRQGWAFFQDDRLEPGALGEERRGTTDDPPADDDEVGGFGR